MGHKRTSVEAAKSRKRRKTCSPNTQHGRKPLENILKKPGEETDDSSSETSGESSVVSSCISMDSTAKETVQNGVLKPEITQCLAVDCEMVGVGEFRCSALARCSVVNYHGHILFDSFVRPEEPVTDYRTKWSGIRESDLKGALSFKQARKQVKTLTKNSILVGHSIQCDLHALNLCHPRHLIRDTARYYPIRSLAGLPVNTTPSLKDLSSILLNQNIQGEEHCSVEDARATMSLYRLCEQQWEKELRGELSIQSYLEDLYWPAWTNTGNCD